MVKSFLMAGQSNMAGRGFIHDVSPIIMNEYKCCEMGDGR